MQTFTKTNATDSPDALHCEAEGLQQLSETLADAGVEKVGVPVVHSVSDHELVLDRIPSARPNDRQWRALGEGLAGMHRVRQAHYGWHRNNFIGLAPQPNRWTSDWGQFFVRDRLGFQVSRIGNASVRNEFASILDEHGDRLAAYLDTHTDPPSLLHGDLWGGNVLFSQDRPWLIDPAVYCGDREADLAMTEMFGGFSPVFYQAYDAVYPRTAAYPQKLAIYNLYHYLNHYNLFGSGYLGGCRAGFEQIMRLVALRSESFD